MGISRVGVVILGGWLAACGDDGAKLPDARPIDARVCDPVSTGTLDFIEYDPQGYIVWGGPVTGTLADGLPLFYEIEFYGGIETSLAGTFDLALGNQQNFSTCAICVRAFGISGQSIAKRYYHNGGTITLNSDPLVSKTLDATITGLTFEEVTIDSMTAVSTPVQGGSCGSMADQTAQHDAVPNAFTCPHEGYNDGTTCNCVCGEPDPDCVLDTATVAGCTGDERCFHDACVTPPTNDDCQNAAVLTVGTPVTSTTVGAKHNYNAGLGEATCTGEDQPGPDVVYQVTLDALPYTFSLTGLPADVDLSLSLVGPTTDPTTCDANPIGLCVKGADAGFDGDSETFTYTPAAMGTYYLIVDSFYTDVAGAFTLSVTQP